MRLFKKFKIHRHHTMKKANSQHSVELTNVKLSNASKNALKHFRSYVDEPVADAIEHGIWNVPADTYEFIDIKRSFEQKLHEFYSIPDDVLIEVNCFDTSIMSFEKGIYPTYAE